MKSPATTGFAMFRPALIAAILVSGCVTDQPPLAGVPVVEGYAVAPDSVRLWYRVVGSGSQTVLVPFALYHRDRLDSLAGPGRRLVLYDPRGRGKSDSIPAAKTSIDFNISDVEVIRSAVGADSVALIGWSGGGMELFVYTLRHPARVTRLIQLAPVAPRWVPYAESLGSSRQARTDSVAATRLTDRVQAGEFAQNQAGLCRAKAMVDVPPTFGDTTLAHLAPDVCDLPNEWPARIGSYFQVFMRSIEGFDWRADLPRVSTPRLVIHGELDNTPLAGNQEWVAGQANARILVIPGAGHWPHYERPVVTLAALRQFLDGKWPDGSVTVP